MTRIPLSPRVTRVLLSLAVIAPFLLHAAEAVRIDLIERLDQIAYDARLNLTLPNTRDERIVIIDIDEASLEAIGQWPWSRATLADLVNRLFDDFGVQALAFDVAFAERDRGSPAPALRRILDGPLGDNPRVRAAVDAALPKMDPDRVFAEAIAGRNVVLGYIFRRNVESGSDTKGMLPPGIGVPPNIAGALSLPRPRGYSANLSLLQEGAAGGGFFNNPLVSSDGVFRRIPLLQQYDGQLYEVLALATARAALGWPPLTLEMARDAGYHSLEAIHLGDRRIPVDRRGAIFVPYIGPQRSFPYVSAKDVLAGNADPAVLDGRIALVGATAAGLLDLRSTPVQNVYPGVEVQANIVSGLLDGRSKQKPPYVAGLELVGLTLLALAMTTLMPLLSPLWLGGATLALAGAVTAGNVAAWDSANLVLPLASPLLLIGSLFVFHVGWGFLVETRGKRRLARLFGQYVPPELVDEMDRAPESISLAGESREMTVLFSDVRGFTSMSEQLAPSELTRLMNAFLTPMTQTIHHHRGTIDKYMGDAVMAFWGAPLRDSDHARHALEAACDLLAVVEDLAPQFRREGWPPIQIGIGLSTGTMSVGNMGSEFRMAYTALGDAVNLGSRLEGLTRSYGVPLIVSETTRAAVPDYAFREIDVVRVKGKEQPVAIFEPLGPEAELDSCTRDALARYHDALAHYRARNWARAEALLQALASDDPERTMYRVYLERIALYRNEPPADDWDGVSTHAAK